jgi:hypothetical protein
VGLAWKSRAVSGKCDDLVGCVKAWDTEYVWDNLKKKYQDMATVKFHLVWDTEYVWD